MSETPALLLASMVLLALGACEAGSPGDDGSDIFGDGVPRWTIRVGAEVGGADERPGMLLGSVAGGVLLDDGRFAVVERQLREVRVYDAAGAFVRARGGRGEGPGEFNTINWVDSPDGVTLMAFDTPAGDRLTVWSNAESGPSTHTIDFGPARVAAFSHAGVLDDSTVVVLDQASVPQLTARGRGAMRDTAWVIVADADSGRVVQRRPGAERFAYDLGNQSGAPTVAFGSEPRATVAAGRIVVADTDVPMLEVLGDDGRVLERIQVRVAAVPASAEAATKVRDAGFDRDSALIARLARYNPQLDLPANLVDLREVWSGLPARDTLPRFADIEGDRAGNVWIRRYDAPGADSVTWTRLGPDFEPAGRVALPMAWRILDFEKDRILIALRDALDRPMVRVLTLEPPT